MLNITRKKGQLNRTKPSEDAVICLLMTGAAVADKIALGEAKTIFGTDALDTLGITEGNNPVAYRDIMDFYAKAGEGAELNIMLVSDATTLGNICDKANDIAKKLLESTDGRGVVLLINKKLPGGYESDVENGLEAEVWTAVTKMNELAEYFLAKNIPFVGGLPLIGLDKDTIANLPNRSTLTNDHVFGSGYCEKADGHISMGVLAGWIAKHQVNQNVGRVASGKVTDEAFFPDGTSANDIAIINARAALDTKGILFPVKVGAKAGYFFNDDPCLTAVDRDYSSISWNRTINKAHRIAADVLYEKDKDDVDTDPATGKIEGSIASDWESDVENAVRNQMMQVSGTKKTEISGVKCTIDPDSDINNDEVDLDITVVRKGQAKTINVNIGFGTTI